MSDQLNKFMFNNAPIRGGIVSLAKTWQAVHERQPYPESVTHILGEMVAACALLSASLKFDGTMIMQIHATGPVHMLIVQCHSNLSLRATVKIQENVTQETLQTLSFSNLLNPDNKAYCVITLNPTHKQPGQTPYQGVIPLFDGEKKLQSIAQMIGFYMQTSEQLTTRLWLSANTQRVGGLLLQKLPEKDGIVIPPDDLDHDTWSRAVLLSETVTDQELQSLTPDKLFKRLFREENVALFHPMWVTFSCSCSREKVGNMLRLLGQTEVQNSLIEKETMEIHCDYCNQVYYFDRVDVAQLFHAQTNRITPADQQQH